MREVAVTEDSAGRLLQKTEDFAKAKRNALIWIVTLSALVFSNASDVIEPSGLAAGLKVPKIALLCGLSLGMIYHLYALWLERWKVIRNNPDVQTGVDGPLAERLARQNLIITQLANSSLIKPETFATLQASLKEKISDLERSLKFEKAVHERTDLALRTKVKEAVSLLSNQQAEEIDRAFPIARRTDRFDDISISTVNRDVAIRELKDIAAKFEADQQHAIALSTELQRTFDRLHTIGRDVSLLDRTNFEWFEYRLTLLLAGSALAAAVWDYTGRPSFSVF